MKLNTPLNFDKKPQTPLSLIGKSSICFFPMTNFSGGLVVPPSYWQCDETSFHSHSPTLSLVLYIPNSTRPMMVMTEAVYLVAMLVTASARCLHCNSKEYPRICFFVQHTWYGSCRAARIQV